MFTELRDYINSTAVNIKELIENAFKVFDRLELEHYQDDYVTALMMSGTVDINETTDKILKITHDLQASLLESHDITLVSDTSIAIQTMFLNIILDIQKYDDKDTLAQITKLHAEPNEVLAELGAVVTHKNADDLLMYIERVSPAFVGAVTEMCEDIPEQITEEELNQKQKYITLFNTFTKIADTRDLAITNLLNSGLDLGYLFVVYMNVIGSELDDMPVEVAAKNLIASALISSDGCDNPISIIQKSLDTYISDLSHITKITVIITDLLLKFNMVKGK